MGSEITPIIEASLRTKTGGKSPNSVDLGWTLIFLPISGQKESNSYLLCDGPVAPIMLTS